MAHLEGTSFRTCFQPASVPGYHQSETANELDVRSFPGLLEQFYSYMRRQQIETRDETLPDRATTCFHLREKQTIIQSCWPGTFLKIQDDLETKHFAIPLCCVCVAESRAVEGSRPKRGATVAIILAGESGQKSGKKKSRKAPELSSGNEYEPLQTHAPPALNSSCYQSANSTAGEVVQPIPPPAPPALPPTSEDWDRAFQGIMDGDQLTLVDDYCEIHHEQYDPESSCTQCEAEDHSY